MRKSLSVNKIESFISNTELLALISVSAVLRKEKLLRNFLIIARERKLKPGKIYEALLQTYLFAGFPSALISLSIFSEYFKRNKKNITLNNFEKIKADGEKTCRKIYGYKYEKLISNTSGFSPELSEWLVIEGYGKVLSRKGLSLKEREILNVAVLSALKFENQLYSHFNGAYINGANIKELSGIIKSLEIFSSTISSFGFKVMDKFIKQKRITN